MSDLVGVFPAKPLAKWPACCGAKVVNTAPTFRGMMAGTKERKCPSGYFEYVVCRKDTLVGVAVRHGVTCSELRRVNGLSSDTLFSGQCLFVRSADVTVVVDDGKKLPAVLPTDLTPTPADEVLKISALYCFQSHRVRGTLTVTPVFIIFEPDAADVVVQRYGTVVCQLCIDKFFALNVSLIGSASLTTDLCSPENRQPADRYICIQITFQSAKADASCALVMVLDAEANHLVQKLSDFSYYVDEEPANSRVLYFPRELSGAFTTGAVPEFPEWGRASGGGDVDDDEDDDQLGSLSVAELGHHKSSRPSWLPEPLPYSSGGIEGSPVVDDYYGEQRPISPSAGRTSRSESGRFVRSFSLSDLVQPPSLVGTSHVLGPKYLPMLVAALPARYRHSDWHLHYSTTQHGVSMRNFFLRVEEQGPSIMVVRDTENNVFGGFASCSWQLQSRYYGNGECFLFQIEPHAVVHPWSGRNSLFLLSTSEFIAMGGGGHFGLCVGADFERGTTGECATFASPPLSTTTEFTCVCVEFWGFKAIPPPKPVHGTH